MSLSFNPAIPRNSYTEKEWALKEQWYVDETNKLQFSSSPTPGEVQNFAIEIDKLLTIARIDFAFVNQKYDRLSMQKKIEETRQFVLLKQQPPSNFANMKLTVDDIKGVVANVIQTTPWGGSSVSLYDLVQIYSARYIFMESVIKLLQDKKDLLITHNGILKIESSLSNMQPSVPSNSHHSFAPQNYADHREG